MILFQDSVAEVEIPIAREKTEKSPVSKQTNASRIADNETRAIIAKKCTEDLVSPVQLSRLYHYGPKAIRSWVKNSGESLPSKYYINVNSTYSDVNPKVTNITSFSR